MQETSFASLQDTLALARKVGDPLADEALMALMDSSDRQSVLESINKTAFNEAFLALSLPSKLSQVRNHIINTIEKADSDLLSKGQTFFSQYSGQLLSLLGLYSLPYCYAGADGAQVLWRSEKIKNMPGKRLFETASFVLDIMSPDAFEPQGSGYLALFKTRLMHAFARYFCLKSNWDMKLGYPVNQEDMAGTNLAFSYICLKGLKKSSVNYDISDGDAYMYFWQQVGLTLGVSESLVCSLIKEAIYLDKAIRLRNFRTSEAGKKLTESLITYFKQTAPDETQSRIVVSLMNYFLGEEIGAYLGLAQSKLDQQVAKALYIFNNHPASPGANRSGYAQAKKTFEQQVQIYFPNQQINIQLPVY